MSNRFNKAALLAGTVMAGAMIALPAHAQDAGDAADAAEEADATVEEVASPAVEEDEGAAIIVTGSRIARRNVETAAPIAVVDAEEFELTGAVNVENVVNSLPQVIPGTTSFSNNPGNGTATLDLRGLGETRTLVLVNGRRWMFSDTNQIVDLNTIPDFLIANVDVVTGGASAVYGSDALAGVVNFNLKQVEGIEMGGQYAITERGDGESYQLHGTIGSSFDDGRGNVTVYAEYFNRSSVFQGDRDFSFYALGGESFGYDLLQFGSSTLPNGVMRYLGGANGLNLGKADPDPEVTKNYDPNAFRERTAGADGTEFVGEEDDFPKSGGLAAVVFDDTPGDFRKRRQNDTYNYAPVNYLQVPQERYLLGGYADYDIGGGHTFYTEVSYVNNRVAQELAATPVTGVFNLDLETIKPFLSEADFAQLVKIDEAETAATNLYNTEMPDQDPDTPGVQFDEPAVDDPGVISMNVQRRTIETGPRNSLDERNAFRVLGGIRGPIGDYLNYDAHYLFARTRNANIQEGNISRSAFQAGLDGTGTAINIFGLGTLTPEMVSAISIRAQNSDVSSLEVFNASISGTFGDFSIGEASPVGFALGGEYRKVGSRFIPDTALSSGDVIGFNAGEPTDGSYDVKEIFAELNIPILDTEDGMRWEINGAGRYSDYSLGNVGGVWTYAAGTQFQPIPDIILRGQYQRAVRAPNVQELFGGRAIGFPGANDPCKAEAAEGVDQAGLTATCIASGVPAANVGDKSVQPDGQIPAVFGGQPNLQEETSDTYTFGIVIQPSAVPGLTITADYYDISIDNAIATFGGGLNNTLDLCFNQVQDINAPICAPFRDGSARNATGAITVANNPFLLQDNIAGLDVTGVDFELNYRTSLGFSLLTQDGESDLNFNFLGTYTEKNNFTPVQGFDKVIECAGKFGTTCLEPTPKYKWNSRLSWIDGPMTLSLRWRHLGSVKDDDEGVDYTAFNGVEKIGTYDLFDLSFAFEVTEEVSFNFGIDNLFDTLPGTPEFDADGNVTNRPNSLLLGDNQQQANTYPSTYDVLGRRYFASIGFKF